MHTTDNLVQYYALRAKEYEQVYTKPERQTDIAHAKEQLKLAFNGANVLEIACGTGFWTRSIAQVTNRIKATDINEEVLTVARDKKYVGEVSFEEMDIYDLHKESPFTTHLFGGFIWSHISVLELPAFITKIVSLLDKGGRVVFIDNVYVEGSSTPISETDEVGNTYQQRTLQDGSEHRVMKNHPSDESLEQVWKEHAAHITITRLQYYWILDVKLK